MRRWLTCTRIGLTRNLVVAYVSALRVTSRSRIAVRFVAPARHTAASISGDGKAEDRVSSAPRLDPLAVQEAWNAGIVVVVAAGNDGRNNSAGTNGYATIDAPGNSPYAITVGAMKHVGHACARRRTPSYSSKGPTLFDHVVKPDLVAPGNRIKFGGVLHRSVPRNHLSPKQRSAVDVPGRWRERN